ncbi:DUF4974 domain-containing protein [Chitinophaga polysaccharea]|uniref:FecR family protein n=1 Tax=Chitinophaga polysaccharea TaxID=1293035 RepID=UPI001455B764|nr:FecR family protein [Chitinophaga polysaccharea]NLR61726.1 DUF4974 domain-containing protein [Chitinophaga polysaccharea]
MQTSIFYMMSPQYLLTLLEKYKDGTCTEEELQQLNDWYNALGAHLPDQLLDAGSETARQLTQQGLASLKEGLSIADAPRTATIIKPFWRRAGSWAAVFLGMLMLAGTVWLLQQKQSSVVVADNGLQQVAGSDYNRYIILPDSSTVLLHAGSRLEYPASFNGSNREVSLSGEAYFDIRHDSTKTFVINTGKLRTTVLGTAFNIKAYPEAREITVSVTRGKVRVEDEHKVLGVLTPDQQIVYNTLAATAEQQSVNAAAKISWVREDMVFESTSFDMIAAALSKRYQVNIRFRNEALKYCLVRASFTGTESLEEVLDVICLVRNASYTIENGHDITIDGKACVAE